MSTSSRRKGFLLLCIVGQVAGEGGAELPYLKCSPPQQPAFRSESETKQVRLTLVAATKQFKQLGGPWKSFVGLNVLDVGMGQGPIGVSALEMGVKSYTGLDPALCINRHAMTHDKSVKHMTDGASCYRPCKSPRSTVYAVCGAKMAKKYRPFPFTGLEMMTAYNSRADANRLVLLPGTFESIQADQTELKRSQLLRPGTYDVATLVTVSEHLPDNHQVLRGIFEWTAPRTRLYVDHHNYYSFRGHHRDPDKVASIDDTNPFHREHARWMHLENQSVSYRDDNLNRVRLGDLAAAIDMYFEDCTYRATVPVLTRELLTCGGDRSIWSRLERRGFARDELLVDHVTFQCLRRGKPAIPPAQASWKLHHPPTDGSYTPAAIPSKLRQEMASRVMAQAPRACPSSSKLQLASSGTMRMRRDRNNTAFGASHKKVKFKGYSPQLRPATHPTQQAWWPFG